MKINFNITGQERKDLANAIGEIMGIAPVYTGGGSSTIECEKYRYAFVIMNFVVGQNGEVAWDDRTNSETLNKVFDGLTERGYTFDRPALETDDFDYGEAQHYPGRYADPDTPPTEEMLRQADAWMEGQPENIGAEGIDFLAIELPSINVKEDILRSLIESKASLIKAALGEDGTGDLPIEFDNGEGKIRFSWLRFGVESNTVKAWSIFLAAACKFSKTAKRVTAKDKPVENEKFAFRTFMVKLKITGPEDKWARKRLMQNLKGDAAFATPESKAKWVEKHQKGGADNENAE